MSSSSSSSSSTPARVLALLADGVEELELVAPVDVLRRAGVDVTLACVRSDEEERRLAESGDGGGAGAGDGGDGASSSSSSSGKLDRDAALRVVGRNGMTMCADTALAWLSDAEATSFDVLLLPGGPAVPRVLRKHARVSRLVESYVRGTRASSSSSSSSKRVAAICAAPLLLLDAGALTRPSAPATFTCHFSVRDEIESTLAALAAESKPSGDGTPATFVFDADARVCIAADARVITSAGAGTAIDFALALVEVLCGADERAAQAKAIAF